MAIDSDGTDVVVSCQLMLPSTESNQQSDYSVFTAKGRTIEEGLNELNMLTGSMLSLRQCRILILGNDYLTRGDMSDLAYLLEQQRVSSNVYLVASAGDARDILKSQVVVEDIAVFHFLRMFNSNLITLGLNRVTLKDFFMRYYTHAGTNTIPVAVPIYTDETHGTTDKEVLLMDMSTTSVLTREGQQLILNKEQSQAYSLIMKKVDSGSITVNIDDTHSFSVSILQTQLKKKFELNSLEANYEIELSVKFSDRVTQGVVGGDPVLTNTEKYALETRIEGMVYDCYSVCKEENVDIFNLYEDFYKKFGKKFHDSVDSDYLNHIRFNPTITIKTT